MEQSLRPIAAVPGGSNTRIGGGRCQVTQRPVGFQPVFSQPYPHRSAQRDQLVVEVIARIVQHARPGAVAIDAMSTLTVADEKIAARLFEQKETEVFGPHRGFYLLLVVRSHQSAEQSAR